MFSVSLTAAFLGGLLSFFAPCGAVIFPSFILYAFKEKRHLVRATVIFWLGFAAVFMPIALGARAVGQFAILYRAETSLVLGGLLIILGVLALFGKGLHAIHPPKFLAIGDQRRNDVISLLFLGAVFAFALIGCSAPILGAIITLASFSAHLTTGILLLLVYTLGLILPLFVLAWLADRYQWHTTKLIRGWGWQLAIGGKTFSLHSTNLIAGLLFIGVGWLFVNGRGTTVLGEWIARTPYLGFFVSVNETLFGLNGIVDIVVVSLLVLLGGWWLWRKLKPTK